MDSPLTEWTAVFESADERACAEVGLMLAARGIAHQYGRAGAVWRLVVPASTAERARDEIARYRSENRPVPAGRVALKQVDSGWSGIAVYVLLLAMIAGFTGRAAFGVDWLAAGRLDAGRVVDGEWWRTVTALTLHIELAHLGGNLVFGAFFGHFVARYLGSGVGWAAIVAAGCLGNLLNAIVQAGTHRAIGASTAVFGALGLLAAYTWRRGFLDGTPWKERIAPVIAGIALLAFTGTGGENTDVFAHLAGFLAGFGLGVLLARVRIPEDPRVQAGFGALAIATVAIAWVTAIVLGQGLR
jgi:rhomboid protease GluP